MINISKMSLRRFVTKPQLNVVILWIGIFLLSTLAVIIKIPETIFSRKQNFFNQWFVKFSWFWTLIITGPYMVLTAFVYGGETWKKSVLRAIIRLVIGTMIWYFWARIVFPLVENLTGVCLDSKNVPNFQIHDKISCKNSNGTWNSFDISGHCFLLTYCILFISSETQLHLHWHKIPNKASLVIPIGSRTLTYVKNRFHKTLKFINLFFILNYTLLFLWHFMIITTCLYFHNFFDKPLGASFAIISWMATYNEWYKHSLSPGLPGKGQLFSLLTSSNKID